MTTDFRALCAELANDLEEWVESYLINDPADEHTAASLKRVDRARAALAAEPKPPADGVVVEPPEAPIWLNNAEAAAWQSGWTSAFAEIRQGLTSPACLVIKPPPGLIETLKGEPGRITLLPGSEAKCPHCDHDTGRP